MTATPTKRAADDNDDGATVAPDNGHAAADDGQHKKAKRLPQDAPALVVDHVDIPASDSTLAKDWYLKALSCFGIKELVCIPWESFKIYGLGNTHPTLWVSPKESDYSGKLAGHVALRATSAAQVDQFYADAIAAGGKDNGKPGFRKHYAPGYYAAFVRDLDGKNVEVVCHVCPDDIDKVEKRMAAKGKVVCWADIPCTDVDRAAKFYGTVFETELKVECTDSKPWAFLPSVSMDTDGTTGVVSGCLASSDEKRGPMSEGCALLYLNADGRIREATELAARSGGKVLEPVHSIGPHGFRSVILDSEGNRVALHSKTDKDKVGATDSDKAKADNGNFVVWCDVPCRDLDRAIAFYSAVLSIKCEKMNANGADGKAFAVFEHGPAAVSGCLVQHPSAAASTGGGPTAYFSVEGRLQAAVDAAVARGSSVIQAIMSIGPHGFMAHVTDSEGNRIGLHSAHM
ncbi:hypothetical protein DFJ73DRAFT_811854 [Zopfochytrium polystomum]|nr:hypothetical protein DFJ73DRAFT_811854 [Zopfochytrium polystomum]